MTFPSSATLTSFLNENKGKAKHCLPRGNRSSSFNFLPVIFFNCVVVSALVEVTFKHVVLLVSKVPSMFWLPVHSITEMITKSSQSTEYVARCPLAIQLQFTTLCCRNNCLLKIGSCKKGTRSMKPAEEEEVEPSEAVSHLFLMIIMCMSSTISPREWIEENAKDRDILPAVMSCLILLRRYIVSLPEINLFVKSSSGSFDGNRKSETENGEIQMSSLRSEKSNIATNSQMKI